MKDLCILSDFDGTITTCDGLYSFISVYAQEGWKQIEQDWVDGKINSKKCLIEEFKLVPNLSEKLIEDFIDNIKIDKFFVDFYKRIIKNGIDFYIVSDGIDYFIEKILLKYGIKNLKIFSNHGDFINGEFILSFPNDNLKCINNAGTCKCSILNNLRQHYETIYYIGDGVSDFCVADKADFLFAKSKLIDYCEKNSILHKKFDNFSNIITELKLN